MNEDSKLQWLKGITLVKIAVLLLVWGIPSLFATEWSLKPFSVAMPEDPFFIRIFGAVQIALALLYWFAYKNPQRNRDIYRYAVVDNAIATLAILGIALTSGLSSWFFWVSGALTLFFAVAFALLLPKAAQATS
jgi:hypothetical protein